MQRVPGSKLWLVTIFIILSGHAIYAQSLRDAEAASIRRDWVQTFHIAIALVDTHPIEGRLLAARAAIELGRYDNAIQLTRAIMRLSRNLRAAHLIRGVAHFRKGQSALAEFYARRALDLSKTPQERAQVRQVLVDIRAVRTWKVRGSAGLSPSTNTNRATTANQVEGIFGTGQYTGEDVRSGTGVNFRLDVRRDFRQSSGTRISPRFGLNANLYQERDLNSGLLWVGLERIRPASRNQFRFGSVTALRQWSRNRVLAQTFQAQAGLGWAQGRAHTNKLTLTLERRNRLDADRLSSSALTLAYDETRSGRGRGQFGWGVQSTFRSSDAPEIGNWTIGGFVSYQWQFTSGWHIDSRLSLTQGIWYEREPLFLTPREDTTMRASVSFLQRDVSHLGLAPQVTLSATRNSSNISIYSYESLDLFLGLTNAF